MKGYDLFFWGILPYIIVTVFVTAIVWRYKTNPFSWTSKSSEMLEKRLLRWGSVLFHYGIIAVFCGHVAGLLVPVSWYRALGVSDEAYHMAAIGGGLPAGLVVLAGALLLLYRRFASPRIRATSSAGDRAAIVMLVLVIASGLLATAGNAASHTDFDYRTTIGPWVRSVLTLQPDPGLMETVPMGFKLHIGLTFVLYLLFPFTRLVHVFSVPLHYLNRSYVLYRRRDGAVYPEQRRRKGAV